MEVALSQVMLTGQDVYPSYRAFPISPVSKKLLRFSVKTGACAMAAAAVLDVGRLEASPLREDDKS